MEDYNMTFCFVYTLLYIIDKADLFSVESGMF
jgi:hypothetical protein